MKNNERTNLHLYTKFGWVSWLLASTFFTYIAYNYTNYEYPIEVQVAYFVLWIIVLIAYLPTFFCLFFLMLKNPTLKFIYFLGILVFLYATNTVLVPLLDTNIGLVGLSVASGLVGFVAFGITSHLYTFFTK